MLFLDTIAGRRVPAIPPTTATDARSPNDGSALATPAPSLTWIGHATFVLRLGACSWRPTRYWSKRISGVIRRQAPPGVAFETCRARRGDGQPTTTTTISTCRPLRRIGKQVVYARPGNADLPPCGWLDKVVELDWWQSTGSAPRDHRGACPALVHARAWNRKDALWGGFVFRGRRGSPTTRRYRAFDGFAEIGQRAGPIDWAMLPIGAYEPLVHGAQHMNPEDAGQGLRTAGRAAFVAMHWEPSSSPTSPLGEPPARIGRFFQERGLDPGRLWIPDIGETARSEFSRETADSCGDLCGEHRNTD